MTPPLPLKNSVPVRGTPGGYRDVWDDEVDPELQTMRTYRDDLEADLAADHQAYRDERERRERRRMSRRAREW
jgi:hypothetical protein